MSKINVTGCSNCPAYSHQYESGTNSCGFSLDVTACLPDSGEPIRLKFYAPKNCPLRSEAITLTFRQ